MNTEERYQLYKYTVSPGWWPILDKYIPQLRTIDPNCEIFIEEKYGTLRLHVVSETHKWSEFRGIEQAAEKESMAICELCGLPGKARTEQGWYQTFCDRCATADHGIREIAVQAAEQRWLQANAANLPEERI